MIRDRAVIMKNHSGCSKRFSSAAAGEVYTGGVRYFTHPPQARLDALLSGGYVEDCDELRTKLAAIFNTGVINIGGCSKWFPTRP
jgi:hypothetical protein